MKLHNVFSLKQWYEYLKNLSPKWQGSLETTFDTLYYDTRLISESKNALFIALRTEKDDGHRYIHEAYQKGIRCFLCEHSLPYADVHALIVPNTWKALQSISAAHRKTFKGQVWGITGSNGKTIVKHWLSQLLDHVVIRHYRSPASFNSQLGVALSLLQAPVDCHYYLIEAGISKQGEMQRLAAMIQPNAGIFTNLGSAHDDGFPSRTIKMKEKMQLFSTTIPIVIHENYQFIFQKHQFRSLYVVGNSSKAWLQYQSRWNKIHITHQGKTYVFELPFYEDFLHYNFVLALGAFVLSGGSIAALPKDLHFLQTPQMRLEVLSNHPRIRIVNDSYNADYESVMASFYYLKRQARPPWKAKVVLTPVQGLSEERHGVLFRYACEHFGAQHCYFIGERFNEVAQQFFHNTYKNTEEFIRRITPEHFYDSVLLLKGARKYRLERLIPYLTGFSKQNYLEVDLSAVKENLTKFIQRIGGKEVILMLKAMGYGVGDWALAYHFQSHPKVKAFAVANVDEAIHLRRHSIEKQLLILMPELQYPEVYWDFQLTPVIGNLDFLQRLSKVAYQKKAVLGVHLEIDTGMGRMGILPKQWEEAITLLQQHPYLHLEALCSHLPNADIEERDDFTFGQLEQFKVFYRKTKRLFPGIYAHVLNSAGAWRFPHYAFDAVRLGIGLLGYLPNAPLKEALRLYATVIRVEKYPKFHGISYGHRFYTKKNIRIATIAIGYEDGLPRNLKNYHVLLHGVEVPIVGAICMDMCMIAVPEELPAKVGDKVLIFGPEKSLMDLAHHAQTIPNEILVRIGRRVSRWYVEER